MVAVNEVEQPIEFTTFNIALVEIEKESQTELIGLTELDLRTLLDLPVIQRGLVRAGTSMNENIGQRGGNQAFAWKRIDSACGQGKREPVREITGSKFDRDSLMFGRAVPEDADSVIPLGGRNFYATNSTVAKKVEGVEQRRFPCTVWTEDDIDSTEVELDIREGAVVPDTNFCQPCQRDLSVLAIATRR